VAPELLRFPLLAETGLVAHAFTTRRGGVSTGPAASLNMGFVAHDSPENVRANRRLVCEALGLDPVNIVAGRQVHGHNAAVVNPEDRGRGALTPEEAFPDTDILLTRESGIVLTSYYADCVPLIFLDPVVKAVALAHAGWRGTVQGVGAKCVRAMGEAFGSRPGDLLAVIGPSAGSCCYEVDEPVQTEFARVFPRWGGLFVPRGPGRWLLDLKEANRLLLADCGVRQIEVSGYCTVCRPDLFYSYRASRETGRMASLIGLV
jgi:YfiH family protein